MKKSQKTVLTQKRLKVTLREMPNPKRVKAGLLRGKKPTLKEQYLQFFVPMPSPVWRHDDDNFSLEQPSPYKWVPSETTYGIDVSLCPTPDA